MTDHLGTPDKRGFRPTDAPAEGSTLDLDAAARALWDEFCPRKEWSARDKERYVRGARACFRTLLPATDLIAEAVMWKACGTISLKNFRQKREWAREGFAAGMAVVLGEGWRL